MTETIFVGVAWPYVNGDPHFGHLAGALLPADIFARYHRLRGNNVLLVSGSDTHGTPITVAADKAGIPPAALFPRYHQRFLDVLTQLDISFDLYTHTHTENHERVVQDLFKELYAAGYIYADTETLLYSAHEQRFLPDRYVEGECPHCGFTDARGDQCDQCGQLLDANALLRPRHALTDEPLEVRQTNSLFLDFPRLQPALSAYVAAHAAVWRPHVAKFAQGLLDQGLPPRAVTRDLDWGIPVPLPGWEQKRIYIWFENIVGYLSAAIEWASLQGEPEAWRHFWTNPTARSYYFLGKDNVPFHTLFWPAELIGANQLYQRDGETGLNLPYDVPANAHVTIAQRQISKSRRWAVWLPDALTRYQPDAIRYVAAASAPETRDTDFTWGEFVRRVNDELVATWGNLVYRVTRFAQRHFDGVVPTPAGSRPIDTALDAKISTGFDTVGTQISAVQLRRGLQTALALARDVNIYLDNAPWYAVIKTDRDAAATTVYHALRAIDSINTLLAPYLPHAAEQLRQAFGHATPLFGSLTQSEVAETTRHHRILRYAPENAAGRWTPSQLAAGQQLGEPPRLFIKLDAEEVVPQEEARLRGELPLATV